MHKLIIGFAGRHDITCSSLVVLNTYSCKYRLYHLAEGRVCDRLNVGLFRIGTEEINVVNCANGEQHGLIVQMRRVVGDSDLKCLINKTNKKQGKAQKEDKYLEDLE